jgi:hypothetical protein
MSNFTTVCMEDFEETDPKRLGEMYCQRCRNPECERAGWSQDKFGARMATQADRLLRPEVTLIAREAPKYAMLSDFVDATRSALRLEISDRRGDWTIPEETRTPLPVVEPQPDPEQELAEENEALIAAPTPPPETVVDVIPEPILRHPDTKNLPKGNPEGIMIGGGSTPPPKRPVQPPVDDWEIKPTVVKVTPGARIKLGDK